MEKIFSYGTLQEEHIQQEVIGRILGQGEPDILLGYKMAKLRGVHQDYNIIQPFAGGMINGVIYEVTPEELAMIDAYEGDAYTRVSVTLKSNLRVWVYRDNPRSTHAHHVIAIDE